MTDDKDGHRPSPLIRFRCTELRHALPEGEMNKRAPPTASKSKLKVVRPDRSNYFNYKNDGGMNESYCSATGRKLLTSPGNAALYTFLMNTWNTLPESYQQRVYTSTVATMKCQIEQAENATSTVLISVEAAGVDNAILLDYLTSEVALEEPEIRSTDPNIPIDNDCTDDERHFGMPGGSLNYKDVGDKSDECNAIPTASRRRWATTELERFDLRTSNVDWYYGEDGNDADADEEEEASQAYDESAQNAEKWGHSPFDLGTSDVDRYEGNDGDDVDAHEEREVLQADDGSMRSVEDRENTRFDLGTGDVDRYEGKHG